MIESDCLVAIQAIRSPLNMLSYFGGIVQECRALLYCLKHVSLVFIKRSANKVAHAIARETCYIADRSFGGDSISSEVHDVLLNDLNE